METIRVTLKKNKTSKKFGVTFKKGMQLNYNKSLGCVEHPMIPNVCLKVSETEITIL